MPQIALRLVLTRTRKSRHPGMLPACYVTSLAHAMLAQPSAKLLAALCSIMPGSSVCHVALFAVRRGQEVLHVYGRDLAIGHLAGGGNAAAKADQLNLIGGEHYVVEWVQSLAQVGFTVQLRIAEALPDSKIITLVNVTRFLRRSRCLSTKGFGMFDASTPQNPS